MIGRATMDDAAQMGRILSDWIDATPWMPRLYSRAEDAEFCAGLLENSDVLIWHEAGKVRGFLALAAGEISALYVAAAERGKGIGHSLITSAKRAATGPLSLWTFQANEGALRFYRREGFDEVERTDGADNNERLPDVKLMWRT